MPIPPLPIIVVCLTGGIWEHSAQLRGEGQPSGHGRPPTTCEDRPARVAQLRTAVEHRAVIFQAQGIVMARTGCDAERAVRLLAQQSQDENRKLWMVAAELVHNVRRG